MPFHTASIRTPEASSEMFSRADRTRIPFFELGLVGGTVVTVAGKAVKLIDQYRLKGVLEYEQLYKKKLYSI
jgi:hypothetical protein